MPENKNKSKSNYDILLVTDKKVIKEYATVFSIIKEALPFELIAIIGGLLSGIILSRVETTFSEISGLLVLIPGIMSLRGNISSSLGSRISSLIHLGLVTKVDWKNEELLSNIIGSMILTVIVSLILGIFNHLSLIFLNLNSVGCLYLVLISITSSFFSGVILSIISVFLAIGSFNIGLDPDNILTSAIATIGDLLSIIMIFISAKVIFG